MVPSTKRLGGHILDGDMSFLLGSISGGPIVRVAPPDRYWLAVLGIAGTLFLVTRDVCLADEPDAPVPAVLDMARDGYERIRENIQDYSCLLVKRERVEGRLGDYQYMYAKVRHERRDSNGQLLAPFSVYLRFLGPADLKGREVLYVDGHNDGLLVARKGGVRFAFMTTELDPHSELAMRDNRYPITEIGIENLVRRFVEVAEEGALLQDCSIQLYQGAKVDGRACLCIEVTQRDTRETRPEFYRARVYIDDELQIPIHYEAFGWPETSEGEPQLLEQYTYRDLKLNIGLSDDDFARDNPAYGFR
jgi:hypothetical protein